MARRLLLKKNYYSDEIYQEKGFDNRRAYLDSLREEYGAYTVTQFLNLLPSSEDFDGLITSLNDYRASHNLSTK